MTRNVLSQLLSVAAVAVVLAIAIPIILQRQTDGPITMDQVESVDGNAYHIIESAYWTVPTEGESARRSDLVAIAEVEEELPAFWSTPDRKRPQLSGRELMLSPQYRIYTPYKLRITQTIKGEIEGDGVIQLNRLGGHVDGDVTSSEDDLFTFEQGMKVVVFLRDCGEERALRLGSPGAQYRIINRFVIDEKGNLSDSDYDLNELTKVVDREGNLDAKGGVVGCG